MNMYERGGFCRLIAHVHPEPLSTMHRACKCKLRDVHQRDVLELSNDPGSGAWSDLPGDAGSPAAVLDAFWGEKTMTCEDCRAES